MSDKRKKNIPSLSVALGDVSLMLKKGKSKKEGRKYKPEEVKELTDLMAKNHCRVFCEGGEGGGGKVLFELKELIVVPYCDQMVIDYLKLMTGCSSLLSNEGLSFLFFLSQYLSPSFFLLLCFLKTYFKNNLQKACWNVGTEGEEVRNAQRLARQGGA